MRRILVKSLNEAFDFVMDHYYPAGCEEDAKRKDTYAVISIQDTHTGGFGVTFAENKICKGVLTLYFDDVVKETKGAVLFDENMTARLCRQNPRDIALNKQLADCKRQ